MADTSKILVEVAYAKEHEQVIIPLNVDAGTTLEQAVQLSGILELYPEIDLAQNKTGIFGKIAKADTELREKDRVEIYRALIADPKESRRKRAEKKEKTSQEKED
ncbi:MAG: RnfH family protein [Gammaproteobacteria bacterium]|nr:RnfH family protein [Gammaproteobacteria bacterium]